MFSLNVLQLFPIILRIKAKCFNLAPKALYELVPFSLDHVSLISTSGFCVLCFVVFMFVVLFAQNTLSPNLFVPESFLGLIILFKVINFR